MKQTPWQEVINKNEEDPFKKGDQIVWILISVATSVLVGIFIYNHW